MYIEKQTTRSNIERENSGRTTPGNRTESKLMKSATGPNNSERRNRSPMGGNKLNGTNRVMIFTGHDLDNLKSAASGKGGATVVYPNEKKRISSKGNLAYHSEIRYLEEDPDSSLDLTDK